MSFDSSILWNYQNELINIEEMIPPVPYTRKGYMKKYEYVYDEYNDIYICPNMKDLIPTSVVSKDGYISYKADKNDCCNCPLKEKCTKEKYKQILRHVWKKYKEMANDYRHCKKE